MSYLDGCLEVLERLEASVEERISFLEESNQRQRDVLAFFKQVKAEKLEREREREELRNQEFERQQVEQERVLKSSQGPQPPLSPSSISPDNKNDCFPADGETVSAKSSSSSLEDILARARVLRQSASKQGKQAGQSHARPQAKGQDLKRSSSQNKLEAALAIAKAQPKAQAKSQVPRVGQAKAQPKTHPRSQPRGGASSAALGGGGVAKKRPPWVTEALPPPQSSQFARPRPPLPALPTQSQPHQSPPQKHPPLPRRSALEDFLAQAAIVTNPFHVPFCYLSPGEPGYHPTMGHRGSGLMPSSEVLMAQAAALSKIEGRPTFPPSLCFTLVERERLVEAGVRLSSASSSSTPPVNRGQSEDIPPPANLLPMLQQLRQQFERVWATRLQRAQAQAKAKASAYGCNSTGLGLAAELSPSERTELLTMWYRWHKLLELYKAMHPPRPGSKEAMAKLLAAAAASPQLSPGARAAAAAAVAKKAASATTDRKSVAGSSGGSGSGRKAQEAEDEEERSARRRLADMHEELISTMPLLAPLPLPSPLPAFAQAASSSGGGSSGLRVLASKEWLKSAHDAVDSFHDALQSRVEFVAETGLGRMLFRELHTRLRRCQDKDKDGRREGGGTGAELGEWREALRVYRAAHCVLVERAQTSKCRFLEKQPDG